MRLAFERLERRDLFAHLAIEVAGPSMGFVGEEVIYTVVLRNPHSRDITAKASLSVPLNPVAWTLDGESAPSSNFTVELKPGNVVVVEAAGRIPSDVDHFLLFGDIDIENGGPLIYHATVVLDPFVDEWTVDTIINDVAGIRHEQNDSNWFHSAVPAGDLNGDGFDDVYLNYVNRHLYSVDDEYTYDWQRRRQTLFGSAEKLPNYLLESEDEIIEVWKGLKENPSPEDTPPRFRNAAFSSGEMILVGDVDGDGFEDGVLGRPHDLGDVGTAKLFFGPDFRDNVLIIGGTTVAQPGGELFFGAHAGSLRDINGDGLNDFYILASAFGEEMLYVFSGRRFDRDIIGDIDRDGIVGLDDFSILAANFGRSGMTRMEGDLDGDARVTFEDYVIFSRTFGRTNGPIAASTEVERDRVSHGPHRMG